MNLSKRDILERADITALLTKEGASVAVTCSGVTAKKHLMPHGFKSLDDFKASIDFIIMLNECIETITEQIEALREN